MTSSKKLQDYLLFCEGKGTEITAADDHSALIMAASKVEVSDRTNVIFCLSTPNGRCIFAGEKWREGSDSKHQVTGKLNCVDVKINW